MSDIANHLANVGVVIAIVTEARPNVIYELGVRNALKRKTIMFAERGLPIPSQQEDTAVVSFHTREAINCTKLPTEAGRTAFTSRQMPTKALQPTYPPRG